MPIQKLILICIVFASALLGSVLAADKPSAQADMDKLQEQVRTLDKELAVQREAFVRKLDDVEKRQIEITAQQANSLAAIANQTTALGNYIAYTSAAITVIVFIAGIATYFSAKSKAEKEARVSSKQWFDQNAADLKQEIENLRAATLDGSGQIRSHVAQFQADADAERKKVIEITEASRTLLQSIQVTTGDEPISVTNQLALTTVQDAREALKAKPESQFTASDFYARGLAYFSESNYQSALSSFEDAVKLVDISSTPAQLAQYLFAKGVTLGQLDKSQDEIAVYDDLDRRFGADTTPAVREVVARGLFHKGFRLGQLDKSQDEIAVYDDLDRRFGADTTPAVRELVARGLNAAGFNRILLAKQCWPDEERRVGLLLASTDGLKRAVLKRSDENLAMASGNLGYSLFLSGDRRAAEAPTLECLRLGGQKLLEAQRKDATLHRVEPEDSQYEELLNKLWQSLPPEATGS